ncbi:MAG: flavin reductase family protein [Propioniciclava sp.]
MPTAEPTLPVADFTHAFRLHPAGVAVVTADAGDGPVAMAVSSLFSVSISPPTLVFSASALSSSTPTLVRAETVVAHLVSADNVDLAKLCATSGVDRFGDDVEWARLPTGEPYYPGADAWLRGRVVDRVDVAGSTLLIVEALSAKPRPEGPVSEGAPLVYQGRRWFTLREDAVLQEKSVPFHAIYGRVDDLF